MEIPDVRKTVGNQEKVEVHLPTEINFARELHQKVIQGLDNPDDIPPNVDQWLKNGDTLRDNWEAFKVTVIAKIESSETSEEQKKMLCDLLSTDLCVYMDLMASTWENFREHFV